MDVHVTVNKDAPVPTVVKGRGDRYPVLVGHADCRRSQRPDIGAPPWKVSSLGGTVFRLCGAVSLGSTTIAPVGQNASATPRGAGAAKHCGLSPRASFSLACAIARQPLHDIPIHALGSRSHQERRKFAPRRAQSGLIRGGRREPISRQPPRADLPRDLPTNSWHRQEPATARLGVTGSPTHEFLQIDHSGKIRPNGSPGGRRFGWLGQSR